MAASAVDRHGWLPGRVPLRLRSGLSAPASVQVLKGPQGTLFGRNTTGGAILFEPRPPGKALEGFASLTGGDYGLREFVGALNIPLSENLAIRIAAHIGQRDGYTRDVVQNATYQTRDFNSVRFGALFARGNLENYFLANHVDYKESGSGNILLYVRPGNPALDPRWLPSRRSASGRPHSVTDERDGDDSRTLRKTVRKPAAYVTLIASWTHRRTLRRVDEDGRRRSSWTPSDRAGHLAQESGGVYRRAAAEGNSWAAN